VLTEPSDPIHARSNSRKPCACRLLGIEGWLSREYEEVLLQGDELIRPGFVRLSVNYFSSELAASFVGDAVRFIADNGWKLLPAYTFLPETGEWRHRCVLSV
jgi:hypothetical protein